MSYEELLNNFRIKKKEEMLLIVDTFCEQNGLVGVDGLYGQLSYVKAIDSKRQKDEEEAGLMRDMYEIAFSIWALEELNYSYIAIDVAQNLKNGGAYGDTTGYLSSSEGNYFKNFLLQLQVGLRLVEHGFHILCGDDRTGEPDYYIESEDLAIEVKAPASRLALFQAIIKGVQQIESYGSPGIIIITLDHMVARGMIKEVETALPNEIIDIILSALPANDSCKTIGVIAEWCRWQGNEAFTTVQPIMNTVKGCSENNRNSIRGVWSAFSHEDVSKLEIHVANANHSYPYNEDYSKGIDEKVFFSSIWTRMLYHISLELDDKNLFPRVPSSKLSGEDNKTERICLSNSISNCLGSFAGKFILVNKLRYATHVFLLVYSFDESKIGSKNILYPSTVKSHGVSDAENYQEHWILTQSPNVKSLVRIKRIEYENCKYKGKVVGESLVLENEIEVRERKDTVVFSHKELFDEFIELCKLKDFEFRASAISARRKLLGVIPSLKLSDSFSITYTIPAMMSAKDLWLTIEKENNLNKKIKFINGYDKIRKKTKRLVDTFINFSKKIINCSY
jgi:hypothetical protein